MSTIGTITVGHALAGGPIALPTEVPATVAKVTGSADLGTKIAFAISPDDLHELTVALASYMERQSLSASVG